MKLVLTALVLATFVGLSAQQPFNFTAVDSVPKQSEQQQRMDVNYTGFLYNFRTGVAAGGGTPNGSLKPNMVFDNPFLSTLPGTGNAQALVTFGPCAGNTIHSHPRGSEISFVTYGTVVFGMSEEDTPAGDNPAVVRTMQAGETVHIPQGLIHYSHNPTCLGAQFLANFGNLDPGTQTTWSALVAVPTSIIQLSTGIPESQIDQLKTLPLLIAPGTGGEECLKKCGLDFQKTNTFLPAGSP
jgi:quercetin dioxygenase-like cupin family protein